MSRLVQPQVCPRPAPGLGTAEAGVSGRSAEPCDASNDAPVLVRTPRARVKPFDWNARHDRTMSVIIAEGVLFVVLSTAGATLLYFVVAQFTR
jgi:hypothetical protein